MSAERALAAAVRAAALADGGVQAVLGDPARFYDDPPPNPAFPYATFGRFGSRASESSEAPGLEHVVTLHVWSRHGGRAEALDVIAALREALHGAALAVEGRALVYLFASFTDVFRSGDAKTTHGILRLRALTEPQ